MRLLIFIFDHLLVKRYSYLHSYSILVASDLLVSARIKPTVFQK